MIISQEHKPLGITEHELFQEFLHQAELIAPLTLPVLLYGAPGMALTFLAQHIHAKSQRAHQKFVTLDCARFSSTQDFCSREQLHAYEQQAHELGSLFIKNIQFLTASQQEQAYTFIARETKMRIIVSARPDLFRRVQAGTFSANLFYILQSLPLEIVTANRYKLSEISW